MEVQMSLQVSDFIPLDKYPDMGLLDHMVILFLIFWVINILFFTVAIPIYIPTKSAQGFAFLHILTDISSSLPRAGIWTHAFSFQNL